MNALRPLFPVLCALVLAAPAARAETPKAAEETIKDPKPGTPEAAVAGALQAALAGDFALYLDVIHPEFKDTDEQKRQRERYEWKRFLPQARWYLVAEKPLTFVVTSRKADGDRFVTLYIKDQKNKERMPVPVSLKKDGEVWKIRTSSL